MEALTIIITIGIVLYCSVGMHFYLSQNKKLYKPKKDINTTPITIGLNYEDIFLTTQDFIKINTWYIPAKKQNAKTILCCHGNTGNLSHRLDTIKLFHNLDLNVTFFDYRGYGRSEGSPTENGTYHDAIAVWNFLIKEKKEKPENIIIFGRSLGGAIAANLATKVNPTGLIIESTFTSVSDVAQRAFPIFPAKFLIKNKYSSINLISKIQGPVLVIHSREDKLIPYSHGEKLFKQIECKKEFLEIKGGHKRGFIETGEKYTNGIKGFVNRL
jgi:uncharacterized protein